MSFHRAKRPSPAKRWPWTPKWEASRGRLDHKNDRIVLHSQRVAVPTRGLNSCKPNKRIIRPAARSLSSNRKPCGTELSNDKCNKEKPILRAAGLGLFNALPPSIRPGSTDNNKSSPKRSQAITNCVQRSRDSKVLAIDRLDDRSLDFIAALVRHKSQGVSSDPSRKMTKSSPISIINPCNTCEPPKPSRISPIIDLNTFLIQIDSGIFSHADHRLKN